MRRIIICGWVRCGNQWLQRLFEHYFGPEMPVEISHMTVGSHFDVDIRWDREPGEICDTYLVHTRRDLRDAFVSWYYLLTPGKLYLPAGTTFKEYLAWLTEERYYPLHKYVGSWLKLETLAPANVSWTSHERARDDRKGELIRIVGEMGYPVDEQHADLAAQLLALEPPRAAYTGQVPTQETAKEEPCGVPGMWKTHFDTGDVHMIEDFCGDLIVRLGYGGDPDWERLLGRGPKAVWLTPQRHQALGAAARKDG
jgi:hypothetical protein